MPSFEFDFHPTYRWLVLPLGATPGNSVVTVTSTDFTAKFGPWKVETPRTNVIGFERSGDYKWYRAIGVRSSLADHGLTFGSTTSHGVCVKFQDPVPSLLPGLRHHPGLTVTVADPDGLVAALAETTPA